MFRVPNSKFQEKGISVVEVVIAIAVVSTAFFAISQVSILAIRASAERNTKSEALMLSQEGMEAVRSIRDASWSTNIAGLNFGSTYYTATSSGQWILTQTDPGLIDGKFTRTVKIENVSRNINDDIVTSGGANDPYTKKVTVTVSWGKSETEDVSYTGGTTDGDLTNFPSNAGYGDPAQSFTSGSQAVSVSKVSLYLKKVGSPSDIYLEIRSGSAVGTLLGTSNTVSGTGLPASLGWVTFSFSSPVNLSASAQYYLRLRSLPDSGIAFSGASPSVYWGYLQTPSSPYAGGSAYRYVNINNSNDPGQLLSQYDYSFQIYKLANQGKSVKLVGYIMDILKN